MSKKKLHFQELRRASGFTSKEIATAAGVSIGQEYAFEIGGTVKKETKERIVQAFSLLTRKQYTLQDFEPEGIEVIMEQETIALRTLSPAPLLPSGAPTHARKQHVHQ